MVLWFFSFPLSSPTSVLCSSVTFWTAACFSWLPLKNVSRHWINESHLLWFQTNFKPIKNLSHLSCSVPTPAWPPEAQMSYLGKSSRVPKYLSVCGLSFVLAVPSVAGHSAASALVTWGCCSPWPDPGMKKGLGSTPCPYQHCQKPSPQSSIFWWCIGGGWDADHRF